MVGYVTVDLYRGRYGREMSIDLYRGRSDRVWRCRSLLGTLWHGIGRLISTGDGMVGYVVVDPYWG